MHVCVHGCVCAHEKCVCSVPVCVCSVPVCVCSVACMRVCVCVHMRNVCSVPVCACVCLNACNDHSKTCYIATTARTISHTHCSVIV